MMKEIIQAMIFREVLFTNSPIFSLSLVNITKGITAKLSCMERITWLKTNNSAVPFSPYQRATKKAGITAIRRVINLRNQGFSLMLRKPSITICPAKVPVHVEFCPEAKSATAKRILAKLVPKIGANILCASCISAIL